VGSELKEVVGFVVGVFVVYVVVVVVACPSSGLGTAALYQALEGAYVGLPPSSGFGTTALDQALGGACGLCV
jgi:hypothetical protein